MKITIIYDNAAFKKDLQADWGFSWKLKIDPLSIEEVFISHLHWDHTGGLSELLKINPNIKKIYLPSSMGLENEVVLKEPTKIQENIFSTGELEGIEQSMGVMTEKGIVLIVGCSHPYMGTILDAAKKFGKIYAIIGGMHGFCEFELFKDINLICPTHCTQHKKELKRLYPEKYLEGGAGRIIEIS